MDVNLQGEQAAGVSTATHLIQVNQSNLLVVLDEEPLTSFGLTMCGA